MGMSSKEKQRRYRERKRSEQAHLVSAWLDHDCWDAVNVIAQGSGVSVEVVINQVLRDALRLDGKRFIPSEEDDDDGWRKDQLDMNFD